MTNLIPCLTSIECRWKPELIQRPDVIEVSGQLRDVTKSELLSQELKIRFDWFESGASRFYQVFNWGALKIPAGDVLLERVPAASLIGPGSVFAEVANDLYSLCKDALDPVEPEVSYGIRTYIPVAAVSRMCISLPLERPRERLVELEVIHYLDSEYTQNAFKKVKQWLGRSLIAERELADEFPCEDLLNHPSIEPRVLLAIKTSAELVKSIYPVFSIDIENWLKLAQGSIDAFAAV